MRWAISPHGEGTKGERVRAIRGGGEGVSAYTGEGSTGAFSFGISSGNLDKQWGGMERERGQHRRVICHAMTTQP